MIKTKYNCEHRICNHGRCIKRCSKCQIITLILCQKSSENQPIPGLGKDVYGMIMDRLPIVYSIVHNNSMSSNLSFNTITSTYEGSYESFIGFICYINSYITVDPLVDCTNKRKEREQEYYDSVDRIYDYNDKCDLKFIYHKNPNSKHVLIYDYNLYTPTNSEEFLAGFIAAMKCFPHDYGMIEHSIEQLGVFLKGDDDCELWDLHYIFDMAYIRKIDTNIHCIHISKN